MMRCKHEIWEREMACADGYCPICLKNKFEIACATLAKIDALAFNHERGAIGKAQTLVRETLNSFEA
jgi:hypothetical protein